VADVVAMDWSEAGLSTVDQALCEYAEKLTMTPAKMTQVDIDRLRDQGLDDAAIHNAIQVISYFNYINRIADAIHVDLDPGMPPYPE
tara:strand:- start:14673 stop:14933 length:261 start_codon:yes stop_codon:yes gene_type:complete